MTSRSTRKPKHLPSGLTTTVGVVEEMLDRAEHRLRGLSVREKTALARAYTLYLELVKVCENAYRTHRLREKLEEEEGSEARASLTFGSAFTRSSNLFARHFGGPMDPTRPLHTLIAVVASGVVLSAAPLPSAGQDLDHRDELTMNSISGGDFRDYISRNIPEEDRWGHAIRMFGTFHNHMHEMMSHFARYAVEEQGDGERVPDFTLRISGGEWGDYRAALEEDGITSSWREFVQVTEIMHDRVHHAMYKATLYDRESRDRGVELGPYVGDRAPHETRETTLDREELTVDFISMEDFRDLVWHHEVEGEDLHQGMQAMMVFDEMLYALMTDWASYGATKEDRACRPPEFGERMSGQQWRTYEDRVQDCPEEEWRHLVQVVGLMHDRIHDMMARADHYIRSRP